jgi:hypothetical protein
MQKSIHKLMLAVALGSALLNVSQPAPACAGEVAFLSENFDSYADGAWPSGFYLFDANYERFPGSHVVSGITPAPPSGTKCFMNTNPYNGWGGDVNVPFTWDWRQYRKLVFGAAVMLPLNASTDDDIGPCLVISPTRRDRITHCTLKETGHDTIELQYANLQGGTSVAAAGLHNNQWYHIRGELDIATGLWDLYLDDVLVKSGIPIFAGRTVADIGDIFLGKGFWHSNPGYFDDVFVKGITGDTTPPTVTITSPDKDVTVRTSTVHVIGTASDDVGVVSVTWANAANQQSGACSGTTSWSCDVPLAVGANQITITAHDAAGNPGSSPRIITYAPITLTLTKNVDWIYANGFSVARIEAMLASGDGKPMPGVDVLFSETGGNEWLIKPATVETAHGLARDCVNSVSGAAAQTDDQGKTYVFLRAPVGPAQAHIRATATVDGVPFPSNEVVLDCVSDAKQNLPPLVLNMNGVQVTLTVRKNDFVLQDFTKQWVGDVLLAFQNAGIQLGTQLEVIVDIGPNDFPYTGGGLGYLNHDVHTDASKRNLAHELTHWVQFSYGLPVPFSNNGTAAWFTDGMARLVEQTLVTGRVPARRDFLPASDWLQIQNPNIGILIYESAADFIAFVGGDDGLPGVRLLLETAQQLNSPLLPSCYLYAITCRAVIQPFPENFQALRQAWRQNGNRNYTWQPFYDCSHDWWWELKCPADLALVDGQGRHLDALHSDIPGGVWDRQEVTPGDYQTIISLDSPAAGHYQLTVTPTGGADPSSKYSLSCGSYDWAMPLAIDQPVPGNPPSAAVFQILLSDTNVSYSPIAFGPPFDGMADKQVECGTEWTFDAPTATSLCSGTNVVISVLSTVTNAGCGNTFTTTRRWEATDGCSYKSNCTQTVTVVDTTPPTIVCPAPITVEFLDENGAVASYAVAVSDGCSSVSLTVTPASGSLFPIGVTTVQAAAVDGCSNVSQCTFTVRVLGALGVKSNVLAELVAVRGSTPMDQSFAAKSDDAILHLQNSLNPAYWIDQTHLQPKGGNTVMNEEKLAVNKLREIMDSNNCPVDPAIPQGFIDRIVSSDRLLAIICIQNAATAGLNAKKIAEDLEEVAKGDAEVAAENYMNGIEHYRNAWRHALRLRLQISLDADGRTQVQFVGNNTKSYLIEMSTDLVNWVPLGTSTEDAGGNVQFTDPGAAHQPLRFYRVVEQ